MVHWCVGIVFRRNYLLVDLSAKIILELKVVMEGSVTEWV